jgi:hypothetical protein
MLRTKPEAPADTPPPPCAGVGSDCAILTISHPGAPMVLARQVIEGLSFHSTQRWVDIMILLELENPGDEPAATRVVHRGDVTGWLEPFSFNTDDPALNLLGRLYSGRITQKPEDPTVALIYPRANCLAVADSPVEVSLTGPSDCFAGGKRNIQLTPECLKGEHPSFTSFLLPEMAPRSRDFFVLRMRIEGLTYAYLMEQYPWFSVASYTRLLRDIKAFDVARASQEAGDLFQTHIEPENMHIIPEAYDIVLFRNSDSTPIEVMDDSVCILPVRPESSELAEKAIWFFGNPASEFYIELCYAEEWAEVTSHGRFVIPASPPSQPVEGVKITSGGSMSGFACAVVKSPEKTLA